MSKQVMIFEPLTSKAGEFKARCNLSQPHPVNAIPHYLRREYDEKGWAKATRSVRLKNGDYQRMECYLEPLCDGFETTDRAAFEEHMKKVHGKNTVNGYHENWSKSIRRGWVSPRSKPEGTPLTKTLAEQIQTCPSCGLHAETPRTYGDELWWREHLDFCVAEEGAA